MKGSQKLQVFLALFLRSVEATGTLTFGGGEFPTTNSNSNIKSVIQSDPLLKGNSILKIIFTVPVKAHAESNYLFANLNSLAAIENIDNLDTSGITNMTSMFAYDGKLTSLDLSNWDTSNVTNMDAMFSSASSLTSLDLFNWDTSKVTKMSEIFEGTKQLDTLRVGAKTFLKSEANLPEKRKLPYTGAWIIQNGTNSYNSSKNFLANYDGTYLGTYVRESVDQDVIKVTGVELLPTTLLLTIGQEHSLQTNLTPLDATNRAVSYTSSDLSIATVDTTGKVTVIGVGTATTQVTVQAKEEELNRIFSDTFYLGISQYVTGYVETSLSAKKIQLVVNDQVVDTINLFSDGSFEVDSKGTITSRGDIVEVFALGKKNVVLDQAKVTIKEKTYSLTVNPYTLYSESVTGVADYYHSHVALFVNGELVENQLLPLIHEFNLEAIDWIESINDEVEVVGYRYGVEITRQAVTIEMLKVIPLSTTINWGMSM